MHQIKGSGDATDVLRIAFLRRLKQQLQSCSEPGDLYASPQPTLVTADTVHDARDVPKVMLEFFLENLLRGLSLQFRT